MENGSRGFPVEGPARPSWTGTPAGDSRRLSPLFGIRLRDLAVTVQESGSQRAEEQRIWGDRLRHVGHRLGVWGPRCASDRWSGRSRTHRDSDVYQVIMNIAQLVGYGKCLQGLGGTVWFSPLR